MEKYGFVYIWLDKKHKRYYIGSHWGKENDGYVCSSRWMRKSYKRRPQDFKRRILSRIYSNRKDILENEHRWLSKIKDSYLGNRYYNLTKHLNGHWTTDLENIKTIGQKISSALKGKPSSNLGKIMSEEQKQRISSSLKGRPINYIRTEETRKKISKNSKRLQQDKKVGMHGKFHSKETKKKMAENNAMNKQENIDKIIAAKNGIKWLKLDSDKKMAVPGTEKWNSLLDMGYKPIGAV
jgi:hypothetical protein